MRVQDLDLLLVKLLSQRSQFPLLPIQCGLQLDALHLQITGFFLQHTVLFDHLIVRLLDHVQLFLQTLIFAPLTLRLHVPLAQLELVLADA